MRLAGEAEKVIDRTQHGFTLIEILVAVVIMGLAYVAVLQSFSMSGRNIAKMDASRTTLFDDSLLFEQQLLNTDQADNNLTASADDVMAEGGRYKLSLISDENDEFMTLMLEEK